VQNDDNGSVETVAKLDADNDADCADQQHSNRNALIDDVSGASGNTEDAALNKKQADTEVMRRELSEDETLTGW